MDFDCTSGGTMNGFDQETDLWVMPMGSILQDQP